MDFENIYDSLMKLKNKCGELEFLMACLRVIYTSKIYDTKSGKEIYLMDDKMIRNLKVKLIDNMSSIAKDIYLE